MTMYKSDGIVYKDLDSLILCTNSTKVDRILHKFSGDVVEETVHDIWRDGNDDCVILFVETTDTNLKIHWDTDFDDDLNPYPSNIKTGVNCNFEFEDLSDELQTKVIEHIQDYLNDEYDGRDLRSEAKEDMYDLERDEW